MRRGAKKTLFTVMLEFRGGTYVAQVRAASSADALVRWVERTDERTLAVWKISREELRRVVGADKPVKIAGLRGVWCASGSVRRQFVLINVVATATGR